MRQIYIAFFGFIILVILALLWYFFGTSLLSFFERPTAPIQNPVVQELELAKPTVRTKEQERELLNDLLPTEVVDTPEEIAQEINRLDALQQGSASQSALDQLNALTGDNSVREQELLLDELAQ